MSKRLTVTVSDNTFQAIQEAGKISRRAPATEAGHFLDNHYATSTVSTQQSAAVLAQTGLPPSETNLVAVETNAVAPTTNAVAPTTNAVAPTTNAVAAETKGLSVGAQAIALLKAQNAAKAALLRKP